MKSHFNQILRVHLYKIVMFVWIAATGFFAILFFKEENSKIEALLGGLLAGLLVAFVQYLLDWNEHSDIEAIKELGIKRILPHRDNKSYYGQALSKAKREIWLLGNTASRFLEDFAHPNREDSNAFLTALQKGVEARILLPEASHLDASERFKAKASRQQLTELTKQFPNLKCRYFNHRPAHSVMKIDDECLVGPVFPNVRSKDSPTIHTYAYSPLVGKYLEHFKEEWDNAPSE